VTWRRLFVVVALLLLVPMPSEALARAKKRVATWRDNSPQFVYENFGVEPDQWQEKALRAFDDPAPDKQRIAMQACVGPGKTTVESWMGWKFLACHAARGEHPKGLALGVTYDNLKDNLWPEFAKWQQRSAFLSEAFTWTKERIFANDHPETWFISARSWPKTASPDEQGKTLSGLHGKFVLVLIDESGTIPMTVLRAADQALSVCTFGKIVQGGNPTSLEGMLYAAATQLRHQWFVIRVTGDPDDPEAWVHAPRLAALHHADGACGCPKCWAREQIDTYGRDNPWVMSAILGQFPPASINALLGIEDVEAAMKRHLRADQYDWAQKRLGVDVARYGDDRTVIFPRQGLAAFKPIVLRHARNSAVSVDIANRVLGAKAHWGSELELFDATGGWAAGAVDVMSAQGYAPINVQFAAPAFDPRYYNRRAEIWFGMADWVKRGGALPPIPELIAELVTPTYTFKTGKMLVEEKALVKQRLGRSPDLADALALTFGMVEMPGMQSLQGQLQHRQQGKATRDFDPYAEPTASAARDFDPNA
jgi:phage terminase large subunit